MTTLTCTMARLSPGMYLRLLLWLAGPWRTGRGDGFLSREAALRRHD
jgi:hypothetical protein